MKNLPANAGDAGWISASVRSPGEGNNNTLQYSCLGNPLDREDWRATAQGFAKSQTQLRTRTMAECRELFLLNFVWPRIESILVNML